jgi:hypothetical protein
MKDNSEVLGQYKGLPITETKIIVNRLGDGLSAAVGISPVVIEASDVAFLAVRVTKTKDRYEYVKDEDGKPIGVVLVQIFDSTGAMFTDNKMAQAGIQKMVDKIKEAEALAKGQLSMSFDDGADVTDINAAKNKKDKAAK